MISPEQGAATQIHLAQAENMEKYSGKYFEKKRLSTTSNEAKNAEAAIRLWEVSEEMTKEWMV
jgi:hypothetical protein